ncbi:amidase signature domain-containing protein [Xylariales sp. PMI_506]|nr:amidase signature domain-containing protein [Xylariales sp. PMI_506]
MSVLRVDPNAPQIAQQDVIDIAAKAGLSLSDQLVADYTTLVGGLEAAIAALPDESSILPIPDLQKYPRTDIHVPEDTDLGGWATKVTAKCTSPTSDLLKGRTVALKDNMALAGVRCTNGTSTVDWTPTIDATVATRIMDAGGIITGKSACENNCLEGLSATSVTGAVHNPWAKGYSAGGSSSGSGRLVGTGAVEMSIGCDQGGSIRIPAASCGIVGLKPTWGLVPYTGILNLDATIDHVGPMAKTVRDCALLLEAIAGPDGWDDRQQLSLGPSDARFKFVAAVDEVVAREQGKMLQGVRVGMLTEGFEVDGQDENVISCVRGAAEKLTALGATVVPVSVPEHKVAPLLWMSSLPLPGGRQALLGRLEGRKQLYFTDRAAMIGPRLTQQQFDSLGPGATNMYLNFLWLSEKHGPGLQSKCMNLLKSVSDAYDKALEQYDVLVMPTLVYPAPKLPEDAYKEGVLKFALRTTGMIANTAAFNNSGHPALSIPVGFVPAREDPSVKLPAGLQLVGRKYADANCLRIAAAWEKVYDWKTL